LLYNFVVVVLAALRSPHAKSTAAVVKEGLHVIINITAENSAIQALLGELGACTGEFVFVRSYVFSIFQHKIVIPKAFVMSNVKARAMQLIFHGFIDF